MRTGLPRPGLARSAHRGRSGNIPDLSPAARRSCRGFESRTHAGGLRWRESLCVYGLCMGFGVHTALINLHPVSGSVEDGFKLCRM